MLSLRPSSDVMQLHVSFMMCANRLKATDITEVRRGQYM